MPRSYEVHSKAPGIIGQAVDLIYSDATRKAENRRQERMRDERWEREDLLRKARIGREQEATRNQRGLSLLQSLLQQAKDPEQKKLILGAMTEQIRDPETPLQLQEGMMPRETMMPLTPEMQQQLGVQKDSISQRDYQRAMKVLTDQLGIDKTKTDIDYKKAQSALQKVREGMVRAQTAYYNALARSKTAGGTGDMPNKSEAVASLIHKGRTQGWDSLTPEERKIVGLDLPLEDMQEIVGGMEGSLKTWRGHWKPGVTDEQKKDFEALQKALSERMKQELRDYITVPKEQGTGDMGQTQFLNPYWLMQGFGSGAPSDRPPQPGQGQAPPQQAQGLDPLGLSDLLGN